MKKVKATIMTFNTPNRNGRVYDSQKMNEAIQEYLLKNPIRLGRIDTGDIIHPVELTEASHIIDELKIEENKLIGDITILDTPQGNNVQALMEANVKLAFAPRMSYEKVVVKDENGNPILNENGEPKIEIKDIHLESIDIIQDNQKAFNEAKIEENNVISE